MKLVPHHFKLGDTVWSYDEELEFYQYTLNEETILTDCFFATKAEAIMDKLQESINWSNQLVLMLQEEINND